MCACVTKTSDSRRIFFAGSAAMSPRSNSSARRSNRKSRKSAGSPKGPFTSSVDTMGCIEVRERPAARVSFLRRRLQILQRIVTGLQARTFPAQPFQDARRECVIRGAVAAQRVADQAVHGVAVTQ